MLRRISAKYLPLAMTLIGAIALSLESYLSLSHRSLCPTEACEVVGKYLIISEPLVVAAGAVFFWFLALLLFFVSRYPGRLKNYPFYLLALALALDSSLMGFQFFSIQQACLLCISVAVLLAVIAILYCFSTRSFVILACFVLIWAGGFGVHKIMVMPVPQGAYANMVFFSTDKARTSFTPTSHRKIKPLQMTLVISMNCPHCLEVISFLGTHPLATSIRLVSIDSDQLSLAKLSMFLQQAPASSNPFKLLHEIKESASVANVPIAKGLKRRTQNGGNFLNNLGITSIPVLVAEYTNEKKILLGSPDIIAFLHKVKL